MTEREAFEAFGRWCMDQLRGDLGTEWTLTREDYDKLDTAASVADGDTGESFRRLADALSEHGSIRVRCEW